MSTPYTWDCLCIHGTTKEWAIERCNICGIERPDTASLKRVVIAVNLAQEALDQFDRLSDSYGRLQAMQVILARHGRL